MFTCFRTDLRFHRWVNSELGHKTSCLHAKEICAFLGDNYRLAQLGNKIPGASTSLKAILDSVMVEAWFKLDIKCVLLLMNYCTRYVGTGAGTVSGDTEERCTIRRFLALSVHVLGKCWPNQFAATRKIVLFSN